jgi:S1-C subfamily serine protease
VDVSARGPAAEAGILPGDVVIGLNGSPIYSVARLRWLLHHVSSGDTVELELSRGGDRLTVEGRLSTARGILPRAVPPNYAPPPARTYLGVHLQEMTADLREAFGAPPGHGVLIAGVMEGSPAGQAGLKAGDLIIKMDRKAVAGIDDVHRALAYFDPGEQVRVEIVRAAKSLAMTVTLRERPGDKAEADWQKTWDYSEYWQKILPPPEYWRRMMDSMMESLEDNWSDLRRRWSEDGREYY